MTEPAETILLIYRIEKNDLFLLLMRTGTHSDLFGEKERIIPCGKRRRGSFYTKAIFSKLKTKD